MDDEGISANAAFPGDRRRAFVLLSADTCRREGLLKRRGERRAALHANQSDLLCANDDVLDKRRLPYAGVPVENDLATGLGQLTLKAALDAALKRLRLSPPPPGPRGAAADDHTCARLAEVAPVSVQGIQNAIAAACSSLIPKG